MATSLLQAEAQRLEVQAKEQAAAAAAAALDVAREGLAFAESRVRRQQP